MTKKYEFSNEEIKEITRMCKENKNKNVDRRLRAVFLYAHGEKRAVIAEKTGYSPSYVSRLIGKFRKKGLAALTENNYLGNNRNMSLEEEKEFLNNFKVKAEKGNIVSTNEIKIAYEKKVGHRIGGGQIYRVLKRNKWRKLMPRSKHPKKASTEAIEASKKLTLLSKIGWKKKETMEL